MASTTIVSSASRRLLTAVAFCSLFWSMLASAQTVLTGAPNTLTLPLGQPFSAAYTGALANTTFTLLGNTPPGVTFTAAVNAATLSGTPTAAGTYNFSIRVFPPTFAVLGPFNTPFTVTVVAPPAAVDLALAVPYATAGSIDLATAVSGAGPTAPSFTITAPPSHGSATLAGSRVTYTPAAGFSGADQLTFVVTGFGGTSTPAHLAITVGRPPDPTGNTGVKAVRDAGNAAIRHLAGGQVRNYQSRFDDLTGDRDCSEPATWAGGFGGRGTLGGTGGFDFDTSGLTVGADRCFGSATIGLGLGYGQDRGTFAGAQGDSKGSATTAATYGSLRLLPGWRVDWMAGAGHVAFDYHRSIAEIDGTAQGRWSATQWQGSVATRFDRHFGDLRLAPYSRVDWSTVQIDGYTEAADPAYALRYGGQRVSTGQALVGLLAEYSHETEFGKTVPRLRIEYQHDFAHRDPLSVGYAGDPSGAVYSLPADSREKRQLTVALGSDFFLRNGLSFALLFSHQQANDSRSNALYLRAVQRY